MNDVQVFNHIGHSSDMVGMRVGSHEVIYSIIAEVFYICGDFGTAARISGVDKHCFIVRQFDRPTLMKCAVSCPAPGFFAVCAESVCAGCSADGVISVDNMYGDVSADVSVTVAAGFWVKNMAAEHAESSSMIVIIIM